MIFRFGCRFQVLALQPYQFRQHRKESSPRSSIEVLHALPKVSRTSRRNTPRGGEDRARVDRSNFYIPLCFMMSHELTAYRQYHHESVRIVLFLGRSTRCSYQSLRGGYILDLSKSSKYAEFQVTSTGLTTALPSPRMQIRADNGENDISQFHSMYNLRRADFRAHR